MMTDMNDYYLAVDKGFCALGLKSIDMIILARIAEYQRNGYECYITNEQFVYYTGESLSTVKRSLDKLEQLNYITRKTHFQEGNGKATKVRILEVNHNVINARFKK